LNPESVVSSCPSLETLSRLGFDSTDEERFRDLEQHIEGCRSCQAALERLARGESARGDGCAEVVAGGTALPQIPGFVIEQELGRGGMSVVYRAWQPRLMRRVALKLMAGGPAATPEARARGLREARSIGRVRDPRVVHLHDVGELDGTLYLVLEYVPGGSLKNRLRRPLPPGVSALLVEQIAGAVAAVQRAGLLHLDLKPSNILLDSSPDSAWELACPRVADFGISRLGGEPGLSQTLLGGPWGTPSYMAPEQLEPIHPAVGPPTDVYALGVILYELLTGRPPFQAASVLETLEQVRDQDPVPLRRINPALPRDLETVCSVCLQKPLERRYATVEALADDLLRWREGLPIKARPLGVVQRAWRLSRRRPLTAGLIAALALTLLCGLLGMFILWQRAESERRLAKRSLDVATANYDVASRALNQISEVAIATLKEPGRAYKIPAYLQSAMEIARSHQLELLHENPLKWQGREQLAILDTLLGSAYRYLERSAEAQLLLDEAIELWEARLAEGTDPELARQQQVRALSELGPILVLDPRAANLIRWSSRVDTVADCLVRSPRYVGQVFDLCRIGRKMADSLATSGASGLANDLLDSDRRRFEAFDRSGPRTLEVSLCKALTLAALGKEDADIQAARPGNDDVRPGSPGRRMLIRALAELAFRRSALRRPGIPLDEPGEDDKAWAERLIQFLRNRCPGLGLADTTVPTIAWGMNELIGGAAMEQRRVDKFNAACLTAGRMKAFSRATLALYPDHAEPALLLCEAYLQDAKNAWRSDDRAAVRQALEKSLEAAIRASSIDPGSEEAHNFVVDRRQRLARLEAGVSGSR